jgi:hypothetical protein
MSESNSKRIKLDGTEEEGSLSRQDDVDLNDVGSSTMGGKTVKPTPQQLALQQQIQAQLQEQLQQQIRAAAEKVSNYKQSR